MDEPWYQTQSPSSEEVLNTMKNSWFYQELCADENSHKANKELQRMVSKQGIVTNPTYITFESIRRTPDWRKKVLNILREEVQKAKPYGSYRGFATFVIEPLRSIFLRRVIQEIWAPRVFEKMKNIWIHQYYAPGGGGYVNAHSSFVSCLN